MDRNLKIYVFSKFAISFLMIVSIVMEQFGLFSLFVSLFLMLNIGFFSKGLDRSEKLTLQKAYVYIKDCNYWKK
ncbi:MAG: hypothetical protein N4A44_02985 [Alphaproteobacteria bacterium]|jgi:hypothetical protein|nr:hypothetical protein [Alphaproteobacteria bacterium]